jgi:pimeloyl-ACP methyl ester carboxylesterase
VTQLIYVGAIVPAQGECAATVMFGAELSAEQGMPNEARCRATMANDMTDEQWRAHWKTIVPEPAAIWNARLSGHPVGQPITYISMADDLGATPELTRRSMTNLGPDVDHRVVPGGHLAMVTKPRELAEIINDLVNC